eukprot:Colp12_sorted_trinity150504_noHs@34966
MAHTNLWNNDNNMFSAFGLHSNITFEESLQNHAEFFGQDCLMGFGLDANKQHSGSFGGIDVLGNNLFSNPNLSPPTTSSSTEELDLSPSCSVSPCSDEKNEGKQEKTKMSAETRRQLRVVREKKRQQTINSGYDELKDLIPGCQDYKISKATILQRCTKYLLALRGTVGGLREEGEKLRAENQRLQQENVRLQAENQSLRALFDVNAAANAFPPAAELESSLLDDLPLPN